MRNDLDAKAVEVVQGCGAGHITVLGRLILSFFDHFSGVTMDLRFFDRQQRPDGDAQTTNLKRMLVFAERFKRLKSLLQVRE